MTEIVKKVEPNFVKMRRQETMENVVIEGLEHILTENRISKEERKLNFMFDAALDKDLYGIVKILH